jgi:multisubunit Na+/H+ antiporter MnhB subunit
MQQLGIHQKKLYAIIEAVFAFIALLLPWTKYNVQGFNMFGGATTIPSENGFRFTGWLVLIGAIAVIVCSILNDRSRDYDKNMKYVSMGGFAAIAIGAIAYLISLNSQGALQTQDGLPVSVSAGMGLWLALAAGIIGLSWVAGILDKLNQKSPSTQPPPSSTPPPPPPPKV